ncbi:GL10084 [Drosophila persimilis]|uniref:GL10084 n=1 Tax=Drosophila persimilis TaxID=7234 RepID=B4H5A9_DROPE|nr:GL10084 [Drosophila persimilis]
MSNQLERLLFFIVVISGALCTVEDYVIMSQCAHNKAIHLAAAGTVSVTDISQIRKYIAINLLLSLPPTTLLAVFFVYRDTSLVCRKCPHNYFLYTKIFSHFCYCFHTPQSPSPSPTHSLASSHDKWNTFSAVELLIISPRLSLE